MLAAGFGLTIAFACNAPSGGVPDNPSLPSGGASGRGGSAGSGAMDGGGAAAGTGATGGSGGTAGAGGSSGYSPCDGVTCQSPPANECADASTLRVYEPTGSCDNGTCLYDASTQTCAGGCAGGVCVGDECQGVTCNAPPAAECSDATHLKVYDAPGSCDGGTCSYGSHEEYCQFGCESGVCNGDECIGVTCNSPPASYCSGPDELTVFDVPGTCSDGDCSYGSHTEYCSFGCEMGGCKGDPCAGVTCNTPDAPFCTDANTLRTFGASGSCSQQTGVCTYPAMDSTCQYGCQNGVCRDCQQDVDCGGGRWCDASTCKDCNTDARCGSSCTDCTAASDVCNTAGTACVDCRNDGHCGSGNFCSNGTCLPCTTNAKCGASCTPCPTNNECYNGACQLCAQDYSCGPSCSACGGSTPYCLNEGGSTRCAQCTSNSHCTGDDVCTNGTCGPPGCPPPAVACQNGSENRDRCSGARTISRTDAGDANGWSISADTCYASDRFDDSGSCYDAGADHTYRIYMWQGESMAVTLNTSWGCSSSFWDATIKIYSNAGCSDTACTNKDVCDDYFEGTKNYTAPRDGWYIIVVDGSTAFDDEGDYTLSVDLTCGAQGCGCSSN